MMTIALSILLAVVSVMGADDGHASAPVQGQRLPPALKKTINTIRPKPQFDGWAVPMNRPDKALRAVVYRWFTSGCPWCRRSLPALEQLRQEFGPRGIQVVAVFHPKPPSPVVGSTAAATGRALGFNGPVAIDEDWSELGRLAGAPGGLSATSVTLVLDPQRRLVHAHRGPEFYPSDDPRKARADAGYRALRGALEQLGAPEQAPASEPEPRPEQKNGPKAA